MSKASSSRSNAFTWTVRIAALASVLASVLAVALGAGIAQRTEILQAALQAWLNSQGVADASLRVTRLGWRGAQIEDIHFGDELSLDELSVSYDVAQLISSHVSTIEIVGLDLTVSDFNTGLIAVVRQYLTTPSRSDAPSSVLLPHIILRNSTVDLRHADNHVTATIAGELRPDGSGDLTVSSGHASVAGLVPFDLSGRVAVDGVRANAEFSTSPDQTLSPVVFKATFDSDKMGATFEVPELRFTPGGLQPGSWLLALNHLDPVSGVFEVNGEVTLSPSGPTSMVRVRFREVGLNEGGFNVADGAGLITVEHAAGGSVLNLQLQNGQAVVGTSQAQQVRLSDITLNGDVNFDTFDVKARLDNAKINHPWIEPLRVTGEGQRNADVVSFSIQAQGNRLSATGQHNISANAGIGTVNVGPWHFASNGLQPKHLSPLFAAIEDARGTVGATFNAQWGEQIDGSVNIVMNDLSLITNSLGVEGVNANLNFAHLTAPVTQTVQTIRAARIDGVVELLQPSIAFRLDPNGALYIDHGESGIAGGTMTLDNQVIEFNTPNHPVTVSFANLDLARLFGLLNIDGVSGTGLLSGSIPLIVSADSVTVDNGKFAAVGPGVLQMQSAAVRNALGGAGKDAALLLEVLNDFHYQSLELNIDKKADGDARILLSMAGSNPAVLDDQPFVLNVTVSTQLDKVLAVLSTALSLSQKALRGTLNSLQ